MAKVHQAGGRIFARILRERGMEINPAQGRILFVLWQEGPMSIYELAKRVSLGKSTLTNALDRLEASGEVKRVRSSDDRRKIVIELTSQNKATQKLYEEVSRKMTKLFYRGFTDNEVTQFERDLERILGNLSD